MGYTQIIQRFKGWSKRLLRFAFAGQNNDT